LKFSARFKTKNLIKIEFYEFHLRHKFIEVVVDRKSNKTFKEVGLQEVDIDPRASALIVQFGVFSEEIDACVVFKGCIY
jgi:hypothetical protein